MAMILKNISGMTAVWGGNEIPHNGTYNIQEVDRNRLASDYSFLFELAVGAAVINDGTSDLSPDEGLLFIKGQLRWVHEDMQLIPASGGLLGLGAPSLTSVSNSVSGWEFDIGDAIYLHTRLDGLIGSTMNIKWHVCINNSTPDRWMAYEFHYTVRAENESTVMTTQSGSISPPPVEAPSTPYAPMEVTLPLPSELFQDGVYLYMGVKRVSAASFGKIDTVNNPILLKACKEHRRRLDYTP